MPTPKIARVSIIVRIPPDLAEALRARAAADDRSIRAVVERAIRAYLAPESATTVR